MTTGTPLTNKKYNAKTQNAFTSCVHLVRICPIESECRDKIRCSTEFLKSIENMVNPYDKDFTAKTIKDVLRDFQLDGKLKKEFFDFSL